VLANHECSFGAGLRGQRVTIDYIARLKRWVPNVLQARARFSRQGPAWANPLPLTHDECENLLCGGNLPPVSRELSFHLAAAAD
jgi:hypothetical protein